MIPYDLVATKMNFWYTSLKNNWPDKAEKIKKEIEQEIDMMEENQDVLIYYSLLEFRHKLQLDYLYSHPGDLDSRFKEFRELRETRDLEGMLEYYYYFFSGMYHFRQKALIHALNFYRKAENQLHSFDCDELEKAEFYFKTSEVYYHMKQTYFSMNYANRAYQIYEKYDTYGERRVHCQFVITGNLIDQMYPDKALVSLHKALEESKRINSGHLIGSSHLNLGICYNQLEELEKSSSHLKAALEAYRNEYPSFLPKTLFNLSFVMAKLRKLTDAENAYLEGMELAKKNKNHDSLAKFKMIKGLYLSFDLDLVREAFKFFRENGMFADMEDYGVIIAKFLEKKEKVYDALEFYRNAIDARVQIQRSGMLNES